MVLQAVSKTRARICGFRVHRVAEADTEHGKKLWGYGDIGKHLVCFWERNDGIEPGVMFLTSPHHGNDIFLSKINAEYREIPFSRRVPRGLNSRVAARVISAAMTDQMKTRSRATKFR